jgi:aldose 1-epimerase
MPATAEECRFRGEPAVRLASDELQATFLPNLGMTGISLRYRDTEYLATPGGLPALRSGKTLGLPLLAPWANRLASRRYRAAGVTVDLTGLPLTTDGKGLPIHGLLVGQPGWHVDRLSTRRDTAMAHASIDVDARAFPFPHRIELTVRAQDARLEVDTTIIPTGRRAVPVAFGWHPYLQLRSAPRRDWLLRLPTRDHLALDPRGIPTGVSSREPAEFDPVARRTFDDLYRLGRNRRLAIVAEDGATVALHCGVNYPYGQVWVPGGRPFAALEPMTAPTNALAHGRTPLVPRGASFMARFALEVSSPRS